MYPSDIFTLCINNFNWDRIRIIWTKRKMTNIEKRKIKKKKQKNGGLVAAAAGVVIFLFIFFFVYPNRKVFPILAKNITITCYYPTTTTSRIIFFTFFFHRFYAKPVCCERRYIYIYLYPVFITVLLYSTHKMLRYIYIFVCL